MKKFLVVLAIILLYGFSPATSFAATTGFELFWTKSSEATAEVTDNNDSTWTYDFTVYNTSSAVEVESEGNGLPSIIDWEFPFFNTAGIQFINSPGNWAYNIETIGIPNLATSWEGVAQWMDPNDPLYRADSPFNDATQVLHWYLQDGFGIAPGDSLGGFSIVAGAGPIDAPYQASWDYGPVVTGDPPVPFKLPNPSSGNPVPEPATLLLFSSGLIGAFMRRKRKA